jgi:hypothetical protein
MIERLLARGFQGVYVEDAEVAHYVPRERCSPRWILGRAYRTGLQAGLVYTDRCQLLFGVPRWMARKCLDTALRAPLEMIHSGRKGGFNTIRRFAFEAGRALGVRRRGGTGAPRVSQLGR